ncbi:F-actin cross-linking protein, partial [Intoshia linei]
GNDLVNLEDAFKIAEEEYDIMQMMDPAEIVDLPTPDEHSVMAYVSSYYHAFSGAEKAKNAANRISKAIVKNMENERDMEDYDKIASALNEWIDIKTKELDDRPGVNDSAMLDKMFNEFREYRSNEKPPKLEEKSKLNTTFETLQTRLRLNGRSPFVPETDKLIEDINNNWKNLELAEKNHEAWLLLTKKIRDRSNFLKQKFERKATIQEQWSEGKIDAMDDSNIMNASLSELKTMIRKQDAFESELQAQEPRIRQLYLIIVELRSMEYGDFENLEFRWEEISKVWEAIQKKSGAFMHSLKERSTHLDEIDVLKLEFAKKVVLFYNWMTSSIEDLEDKFQVMTVSEMELIIRDHEEFKNVFSTSIEKLEDIKETANNTNILADKYNVTVGENEYTTLKLQDIVEKYDELEPAIKVRDEELNEAKTIQIENEKLRFQFATLAKQVNDKVNECANQISALGYNENSTSLEDQINDFSKIEETLNGFEPEMSKIADLSNNLIDAGVFDNQHTTLTIGSVLINWHQQKNNISRTINEINNQILMRDTKGLKEEEIQEYRRSFLHFDKNKTKALDSDEFKSCLISLGRLDVNDDTDKNYGNILADVDPKSTGSVSFSSFMNFMSKERGEANTADQIINSFKIIAGDKPYITADIIKRELPPDQAEYCIVKMLPYEGTDGPEDAYDYNSFSSALYNEASF